MSKIDRSETAAPAVGSPLHGVVRPCPTCGSDCNERDELIKAEREIERLHAELAAEPQVEPVAWMEGPHGALRANPAYRWELPPQTVAWAVPLYAAPQQRKPLTDEQIENCIDTANRQFNGRRIGSGVPQQMTTYDDWKYWLARAIERAHGIGDEA